MPNFKKYSYDQTAMVVIDFTEQLRPGTFEFTLHHLIDSRIDLSAFYQQYNNDAGGRAAYDPAILLKIILFAYFKGVRSSREMQWECEHNIIFKALSCDSVPHFTRIANFISRYPDAIESVFEQVLLVCDQEGLLGNELFAIDGCKMPSNVLKNIRARSLSWPQSVRRFSAILNCALKSISSLIAVALESVSEKIVLNN